MSDQGQGLQPGGEWAGQGDARGVGGRGWIVGDAVGSEATGHTITGESPAFSGPECWSRSVSRLPPTASAPRELFSSPDAPWANISPV